MFLLDEPEKSQAPSARRVAIGYVRQSYTRTGKDTESPERQRANIEAVAKYYGLDLELYEDADGHKSGFTEKGRQGWQKAESRLGDPDVAALIANDLARVHRKGWRIGKLIDFLEDRGVRLILAAPGRQVDLSTPFGRIIVMFIAMCDEWYVLDASQRQLDNVAHRRKMGLTIGMPCFGVRRNEQGYFHPHTEGVWLLVNGQHVAGTVGDAMAQAGAIWRGYYECAERLLRLYVLNQGGYDGVADALNAEGWAFRDRKGKPRAFTRDDVRRVVANWPEYAGLNPSGRAKSRRYRSVEEVEAALSQAQRWVFPLDLLRAVALTHLARSGKTRTTGAPRHAYPYALTGLLRCTHCERRSVERNDPRLRATISGAAKKGELRYRHAEGVKCAATTRSLPLEDVEDAVQMVIGRLSLHPQALSIALDLASQITGPDADPPIDSEARRRKAIQRCQMRIQNAGYRLDNGDINQAEYELRVHQSKEEIDRLEATPPEAASVALSLLDCVRTISSFLVIWNMASPVQRQAVARQLFEEVIFDLDSKCITAYKLTLWAQIFLVMAPP